MKIKINYELTKNYQKVAMEVELEDPTQEEIDSYKNYLKTEVLNELEDVCAKLPVETKQPAAKPSYKAQNPGYNRVSGATGNNYPVNTNGAYNQNNSVKPITDKMKNILLQNGYSNEQIATFTFDQAKSIISGIFGN